MGASAVAMNGMLYVVGGEDNICTQYNMKMDIWTILKPPNQMHVYGCSLLYQGKILLMGGAVAKDLSVLSNVIEEYDIGEGTWKNSGITLPKKLKHCIAMLM